MDFDSELLIDVTNGDVRASKHAWLAALDGDASMERVDELHRGYEQLVRTQARQFVEEFRARA